MFNVGGPEVLIILVVALVVLGPTKLPEAARQVGKAMAEFRRVSSGFQAELRDALAEPVDTTPSAPPAVGRASSAGDADASGAPGAVDPPDPLTTADDEPTA